MAWTCEPYDVSAAARLSAELGLSPVTAAILVRRGHAEPAAAREFLAAADRTAPEHLPGVPAACELLLRHVRAGSRVAVFGDYDVDGVCSTAIAVRALRALGADPLWRLPSRAEGYGLSAEAVRELARAGARVLLTVDCGVTAVAEVAEARSLGMEVVVTDHHRPGPELPDCVVVHPALGDPAARPLGEPCAAGIALKLAEALREGAGLDPGEAQEDLDLAGLATVCDMVPLTGENRRVAREGLLALSRTRKPGLRALMEVAGVEGGEVDARAAGFRLGPRINAAGRLGRADAALELLLTEDAGRAEQVARELDLLNRDRREAEVRILSEAERMCPAQASAAAIVVAGEGWHPGVVGIVASRLVELYHRPCVVIALEDGRGRGSGRSIPAYDLHGGLAAAGEHLAGFGGHRMAAGLELEEAAVPALRAALAAHAGERLRPADLVTAQTVDAVVPAGALTLGLAEELGRLGPFGAGNPAPTLLVPGARIEHVTAMGQEREHARFSIASGGSRARAVAFRTSQRTLAEAGRSAQDVAVSLERNRWQGAVEARALLRSLAPTRSGEVEDAGEPDFWAGLEGELDADPAVWWPASPAAGEPQRAVHDRRGEGFAGVAGDLLTSGEPVLVVVADVERRRRGLEERVAGMSPGNLAVCSWTALGAHPSPAAPFAHLLLLDPPPVAAGIELAAAAAASAAAGAPSRTGHVHLAWGPDERRFALACARAALGVRAPLGELWRASSSAGRLAGEALAAALRGEGPYPRDGALCGRLVRVLCELGLAEHDRAGRSLTALAGARTELLRSPAARAYAARLAEAERYLAEGEPVRAAEAV